MPQKSFLNPYDMRGMKNEELRVEGCGNYKLRNKNHY
jgi:hypothetical protein